MHATTVARHSIRLATSGDQEAIDRLAHDSLTSVGDILGHPSGRLRSFPQIDSAFETTRIVAQQGSRVIGTISMTLDGPHGMPADHAFEQELLAIRAERRRLGNVWRLATDAAIATGKGLVEDLIFSAIRLADENSLETVLFMVPPRFEQLYAMLLLAKRVTAGSLSIGDQELSAILMRVDRETAADSPLMRRFRESGRSVS